MTAREMARWYDYSRLEPFGDVRHNWHAAQITAAIVNTRSGRPRGDAGVQLSEFMWKTEEEWAEEETASTWAAMEAAARPARRQDRSKRKGPVARWLRKQKP